MAAFFYLSDTVYQTGLRWLEARTLGTVGAMGMTGTPHFQWSLRWVSSTAESQHAAKDGSWLPAMEHVGDLFHIGFPPYPLAALGAFLFVFANWLRLHEHLIHALRGRRKAWAWALYGLLILSAMAAIIKPLALYAGVSALKQYLPGLLLIQTSALVDWLAYLFGTAFGVGIQLYLIHFIYLWVHGTLFKHHEVMDAALPQAIPVLKWAATIATLKTALIILPRLLCYTPPFSGWIAPATVEKIIVQLVQPGLALLLLAAASLQISLAFHSKTLKAALRDHYRFLRQHHWEALWFIIVALLHFYAAEFLNTIVSYALQKSGAYLLLWQGGYSLVWGFLSAWLLAAWVCLFRRSTPRQIEDDDPQDLETLRREEWISSF